MEQPSWMEFARLARIYLAVLRWDPESVPVLMRVSRYFRAMHEHRDRSVFVVDTGTVHVGTAVVEFPCQRKSWACSALHTAAKKFSPKDAPRLTAALLERLHPTATDVTLEHQPMPSMQLVEACFETWFHAKGWPPDRIKLRSAASKLSFLGSDVRYDTQEVLRWLRITDVRAKNKLAGVAEARTILETWGDAAGLRDIVANANDGKADDMTDAYLYGCLEFYEWCIVHPYREAVEKWRVRKARTSKKRKYFGMVVLAE